MVNPNRWSSESDSDNTADDAPRPSYAANTPRAPLPERPAPQPEREGLMYTRVSVPLSELIARQPDERLVSAEDDDDDEDEAADHDASSARRKPADAAAEPPEASPEAPAADAAKPLHELASEHGHVFQAADLQPERVESADPPLSADGSAQPATYRSVYAQHSQQIPPLERAPLAVAGEATNPLLQPSAEASPLAADAEIPRPLPPQPLEAAPAYASEYAYRAPEDGATPYPAREQAATAPDYYAPYANTAPTAGYSEVAPNANQHLNYRASAEATRPETGTVNARDSRLVPAFLTAVGIDYFARRRLKKQNAAEHRQLQRTQEAMSAEQQTFAAAQQQANQEQLRFNQEQRRFADEQRLQAAETQRFQAEQREQQAAMPLTYAPERPAAPPTTRFEGQRPAAPERPIPPVVMTPEAPKPAAEQQVVVPEQQPEQPRVHEMQDAWRRYVVDEHNREVATARSYGEAYHQERRQEIQADHTGDTGSSAAGGGAASFGVPTDGLYTQSQQAQPQYASLPSGMTTPSLPAGQQADPQHQLPAGKDDQIKSNITNPWFWLMLFLIGAVFFTATLM